VLPPLDQNPCFTQSRFLSDVCTLVTLRMVHCQCAWGLAKSWFNVSRALSGRTEREGSSCAWSWGIRTREIRVHGSLPGRTARNYLGLFLKG